MIIDPTRADLEIPGSHDPIRVDLQARVYPGDLLAFDGGATYTVQGVSVVVEKKFNSVEQTILQIELGL
jgi:hypothetical protein